MKHNSFSTGICKIIFVLFLCVFMNTFEVNVERKKNSLLSSMGEIVQSSYSLVRQFKSIL